MDLNLDENLLDKFLIPNIYWCSPPLPTPSGSYNYPNDLAAT